MICWSRRSIGVLVVCALGACTLPRGAALESQILSAADAQNADFAKVEVTRTELAQISKWPAGKNAQSTHRWIASGKGIAGTLIAPGDWVKIAVWENGENKLLTAQAAPSAKLQDTRVSPSGTVFVPYIGDVPVAGLSPDKARQRIEEKLLPLIPAAQVQLESQPGRSNSVDLVGGVVTPGNYPLEDRSLTALGLLTLGGGTRPTIENPRLRLLRGKSVYEISLQTLLDDPTQDAGLRAGDKLIVDKDRRYFLSLGATGKESLNPFPQERVTALEAVTLAGGLADARANPKGVLVLREYSPAAVRKDGIGGPEQERMVFTIDLTSADGLFSAQNFEIQDRDIVLATEANSVGIAALLGLLNSSVTIGNKLQ